MAGADEHSAPASGRADAETAVQYDAAKAAAAIMASFGSANVRDRGKVFCRSSLPAYALSRRNCCSARFDSPVKAGKRQWPLTTRWVVLDSCGIEPCHRGPALGEPMS
jgi:hypothetical protein